MAGALQKRVPAVQAMAYGSRRQWWELPLEDLGPMGRPHDTCLAVFSSFHSLCALCTALLGTANVHGAAVSVVTGAARL